MSNSPYNTGKAKQCRVKLICAIGNIKKWLVLLVLLIVTGYNQAPAECYNYMVYIWDKTENRFYRILMRNVTFSARSIVQHILVLTAVGRLPLLSARPAVTFPADEERLWPVPNYTAWRHRHIGVNNLHKLVMQLCPTTLWLPDQRSTAKFNLCIK